MCHFPEELFLNCILNQELESLSNEKNPIHVIEAPHLREGGGRGGGGRCSPHMAAGLCPPCQQRANCAGTGPVRVFLRSNLSPKDHQGWITDKRESLRGTALSGALEGYLFREHFKEVSGLVLRDLNALAGWILIASLQLSNWRDGLTHPSWCLSSNISVSKTVIVFFIILASCFMLPIFSHTSPLTHTTVWTIFKCSVLQFCVLTGFWAGGEPGRKGSPVERGCAVLSPLQARGSSLCGSLNTVFHLPQEAQDSLQASKNMDSLRARSTLLNSPRLCCFYSSAVWFTWNNLSDSGNLSPLHATKLVNISCEIRLTALSAGPRLHTVRTNHFQRRRASVVVTRDCAWKAVAVFVIGDVSWLMSLPRSTFLFQNATAAGGPSPATQDSPESTK